MIKDEASARIWLKSLAHYDAAIEEKLSGFVEMLTVENGLQNLVSANSLEQVWQRHIADSAQLLQFVPRETTPSWLDLGAGAGFPGLIVAILWTNIKMTLLEPRVKRAAWLAYVVEALDLPNVNVLAYRVEALQSCKMEVISARAFAPLAQLLDKSARFSTAETLWLLPKGRSATHELKALSGWDHMFHVEQSLTDPEAALIVGKLAGRAEQNR